MSRCVVSVVVDGDDPGFIAAKWRRFRRGGCAVHCHWSPCPHDGEPAVPTPLHGTDEFGRDDAIAGWEAKTARQRPYVLHHGSWNDKRSHVVTTHRTDCWCDPEVLRPVDAVVTS